MKYKNRVIISILAGILGVLLIGFCYNISVGKPITLKYYFTMHNVSYMKIILNNVDGTTMKSKELSIEDIANYLGQYGSYKIFKPFFRKTFIAEQDKNHIEIILRNENNDFEVIFPLTDQGGINLVRYTFYPYKIKHKDMYNYLLDLLKTS